MTKEKRSTTNLSKKDSAKKKSRRALFFFVLGILGVGLVSILLTNIFSDSLSLTIIAFVFIIVFSLILKFFLSYMAFIAASDDDYQV